MIQFLLVCVIVVNTPVYMYWMSLSIIDLDFYYFLLFFIFLQKKKKGKILDLQQQAQM